MMTSEQRETFESLWREAFGKGLVRWMPGMRGRENGCSGWAHAIDVGKARTLAPWHVIGECPTDEDVLVPDPNDPATVGCILAMAREVTGDDKLHVYWCAFALAWIAMWFPTAADCRTTSGTTEPEAIMRAILAAGGKR